MIKNRNILRCLILVGILSCLGCFGSLLLSSPGIHGNQLEQTKIKKIPIHKIYFEVYSVKLYDPEWYICYWVWEIRLKNVTDNTINNAVFEVQVLTSSRWKTVETSSPYSFEPNTWKTITTRLPYEIALKDRKTRLLIRRGNQIFFQSRKEIIPAARVKTTVFHTYFDGKLHYAVHVQNLSALRICDAKVYAHKYQKNKKKWIYIGEAKSNTKMGPFRTCKYQGEWVKGLFTSMFMVHVKAKKSELDNSEILIDKVTQDLKNVNFINLYENLMWSLKRKGKYYFITIINHNVHPVTDVTLRIASYTHSWFGSWKIPYINPNQKHTQQLGTYTSNDDRTVKVQVFLIKDDTVLVEKELIPE